MMSVFATGLGLCRAAGPGQVGERGRVDDAPRMNTRVLRRHEGDVGAHPDFIEARDGARVDGGEGRAQVRLLQRGEKPRRGCVLAAKAWCKERDDT